MTDETTVSETEVENLLARAAETPVTASADLMARIIADADNVADQRESRPIADLAGRKTGVLAGLFAALGGWPAIAGLTTATVAGIWIGYVSPDSLSSISQSLVTSEVSYDLGDYMPAFSETLEEG